MIQYISLSNRSRRHYNMWNVMHCALCALFNVHTMQLYSISILVWIANATSTDIRHSYITIDRYTPHTNDKLIFILNANWNSYYYENSTYACIQNQNIVFVLFSIKKKLNLSVISFTGHLAHIRTKMVDAWKSFAHFVNVHHQRPAIRLAFYWYNSFI